MKSIKPCLLLLFVGIRFCNAQDTTLLLKPGMFDKDTMHIYISEMHGWLFKQGNDTTWAKMDIDLTGWKKMMPTELSENLADKKGKVEGWFRIKIKLDSAFGETPFGFRISSWAASDLYINGNWIASFGNTGLNGAPYLENRFVSNLLPVPVNIKPGNEYTLALHVVDHLSPFPPYHLKAKESGLSGLIRVTGPKYYKSVVEYFNSRVYLQIIFFIISSVLSLLFWLLFFQNRSEKNLLLFAVTSTFLTISLIGSALSYNRGTSFGGISYVWLWVNQQISTIFLFLFFMALPFVFASIFKRRVSRILKTIFILVLILWVVSTIQIYDFGEKVGAAVLLILFSSIVIASIYYVASSWKTLKGAQWAIVAGLMLMLSIVLSVSIFELIFPRGTIQNEELFVSVMILSFPMSLIVYVAMRFKEIIKEVRENAKQVVQMAEEKREQALNHQKYLQEEVNRQTAEIRTTLDNLKATQHQLIQSEKMASLGELTAGIAHEIQNPLNFVNNFSDVNAELIDEARQEMDKGNVSEAKKILNDIKENEQKINHHGNRADAIVKGMLQHSRNSSGVKEPTDINALADEYLRLAYHGLRAKNNSFNAITKTDYDNSISKINIIPQDIGRVILNLINNAFYAVDEKKKQNQNGYEPIVSVNTKKNNGKVEISVKDNGNGIPQKVLDKIFQPFFTTKPTGQGTGLGLSLSYDIVKAHGGELKVETKEGEGSVFVITLPTNI